MLRTGYGHRFCIRPVNCMTAQAVFEAVRFAPHPPVHGLVSLVLEKIHVVATHEIDIFHATVTLAPGNLRHRYTDIRSIGPGRPNRGRHARKHNR